MFVTRSDVICCSAEDAEAERLGMEAERPAPKRPALSRVTEPIKRRQFDQAPRAARFPRYGPSVTGRAQRMPFGVSAAIVARRGQWLRADASATSLPPCGWTPTFLPVSHPARPRCRFPFPFPGRIAVPMRWRLWACMPSGRTPPQKPVQGGKAFRGGAKRGGSNERTGGVARRRTIQAKTKGYVDCQALRGRLPWRQITLDNYRYQE